jgi:hypothetical protein
MSLSLDRGTRLERRTARILGSQRITRARGKSAPDVCAVLDRAGEQYQPECKSGMRRLPAVVRKALAQARRYTPDAVPVAVVSDVGGEAVACLPLDAFARLLGVAPARLGQLALPLGGVR